MQLLDLPDALLRHAIELLGTLGLRATFASCKALRVPAQAVLCRGLLFPHPGADSGSLGWILQLGADIICVANIARRPLV
jgi:hypothetical protein